MSEGFDLDVFLHDFVAECRESADLAAEDILNLEQKHDQDTIDRIFRSLHSIKGNASMFGLMALSEFVHKVEDTCSDIRSGERAVDRTAINVLLKSFDMIEDAFVSISDRGTDEIDYSRGYELLKDLDPNVEIPGSKEDTQRQAPQEDPVEPKLEIETPAAEAKEADVELDPGKEIELEVPEKPGLKYQSRKNPTALVVDDDFVSRKIFVSLLSKYMPCYIAKDGVEAIQAVTESYAGQAPHFDLIIMDIMMPNIDGLQATKAIRQIERSKNASSFDKEAKIFVASTMNDEKTIHKAVYECQADSYLFKPVDFDELNKHLLRFRLIELPD